MEVDPNSSHEGKEMLSNSSDKDSNEAEKNSVAFENAEINADEETVHFKEKNPAAVFRTTLETSLMFIKNR